MKKLRLLQKSFSSVFFFGLAALTINFPAQAIDELPNRISESEPAWHNSGFLRALSSVRLAPEATVRLDARYALCTNFDIAARRVNANGYWVEKSLNPTASYDCGYLESSATSPRLRHLGGGGVFPNGSGVSLDLRAKPSRLIDLSLKW